MNWKEFISKEMDQPYFKDLLNTVEADSQKSNVYPPYESIFKVFDGVDYDAVNVVILGQDPYHQAGQAMGYSFSVPKGTKLPKSLVNIFKELKDDLDINNTSGDLTPWVQQGVMLLNTILTVRESEPMSHSKIGWQTFTDKVIHTLGNRSRPIVFILWGKEAQKKKNLIQAHHYFIESSHPSPLGAYRGFIGSKPFSKTNDILIEMGHNPIDWRTDV